MVKRCYSSMDNGDPSNPLMTAFYFGSIILPTVQRVDLKAETRARKPVKKPFLSPAEQYQGPERAMAMAGKWIQKTPGVKRRILLIIKFRKVSKNLGKKKISEKIG